MKTRFRLRSLLIATSLLLGNVILAADPACTCCEGDCQCGENCACATEGEKTEAPADAGHPLRGVVVTVLAERQALLVKHEEIPGVMKAMTMMLRVAPAVLQQVKTGDPITATLHRSEDGVWYLDGVKVTAENN